MTQSTVLDGGATTHLLQRTRDSAGSVRLLGAGAWTAGNAVALEAAVGAVLAERSAPVSIDLAGLTEIDTFGFVLLERLVRALDGGTGRLQITGLAPRYADLQKFVHDAAATMTASPAAPRHGVLDRLAWLGELTTATARDLVHLANMLGALSVAVAALLMRPRSLRVTATVHQVDRMCWQAVPIILLITVLIGSIIAQQGFFHFRKFGADDYVVDMVGILVLREIGVLIVAIMVAGRSGSSCTAELGAMRMREEIDALRTMGLDPVQILVLPRILALVIALPILTFLGSVAALYGASVVATLYGGMSPEIFIARLRDAISLDHFKVGMIKAPFMALVIGIVACAEGFQVKGSTDSLGLRTTASVVKSIFLVIILDGCFAIFFASIGM